MSNTVDDIITDLQKFYGRQLNESQAGFWRSQLAQLDENDLCAGVMALKGREPTNYMPTVVTIKKYAMEAREIRLNQEKAKSPTFADIERSVRTEHGRDALRLMLDLSEHRVSREKYIARMWEMHLNYPNYGWNEAATELQAFWESEPKRHERGNEFLETIWRLQDGLNSKSEPRKIVQREFSSITEKEEFYRKLFSGEV